VANRLQSQNNVSAKDGFRLYGCLCILRKFYNLKINTRTYNVTTLSQHIGRTCGVVWLHRGGRDYQQFSFLQVRLTYDTETRPNPLSWDQQCLYSNNADDVSLARLPATFPLASSFLPLLFVRDTLSFSAPVPVGNIESDPDTHIINRSHSLTSWRLWLLTPW